MDSGGRSALREDAALTKLKQKINVPMGNSQYDAYLLRFLRNKNLDIDETVAKLARRREYEKTLPMHSVSAEVVSSLRSRAFSIILSDIMRRPVLYIRMGLHRFSDTASDETLAILILEYIQYVVHQHNVSEFVVLLNEENTGWFATKSAMQEQLVEILQKYYPELLGQVLIVNANWVVTQGVKSTVATQSAKLRNRTKIVRPKELQRFLDVAAIPQELGGSNNTSGTANDFAEHCLRYWYNMTMLIQHEMSIGGGALRTLWQPICGLMSGVIGSMLLEKRNALLSASENRRPGQASPVSIPSGKAERRAAAQETSPYRSVPTLGTSFGDDATDDGCCSVISEQDLDQIAWDQAKKNATAAAAVVLRQPSEDVAAFGTDASLRQQLQIEMHRRKELEQKLHALELGAPASGQTLTRLEGALRVNHEEVNTLVSEVILKGKEKHRGDPSLLSLLELTNSALLQITQERPSIPALRNAAPIDRRPPSSCSIS